MRRAILLMFAFAYLSANAGTTTIDSLKYDIGEIFKILASDKGIFMSMSVGVYPTHDAVAPVYGKKATVTKKGSCFRYTVDKYTMLLNKDYILMVDLQQKTIIVNKNEGLNDFYNTKGAMDISLLYSMLDSTMKSYKNVALISTGYGKRRYRIQRKDILLDNIEMEIDVNTHTITELKYLYDESKLKKNNKVVVKFIEFRVDEHLAQNNFSENEFVKITGNTIKPSKEYEGFTIIKQ